MLNKLTEHTDISLLNKDIIVFAQGVLNNHCYMVGQYKTIESAKHSAKREFNDRAGKYNIRLYCQFGRAYKGNLPLEIYNIISPYQR